MKPKGPSWAARGALWRWTLRITPAIQKSWLSESCPLILSRFRECLRDGRILWTYHVNMRLGQRFIAREAIIAVAGSHEMVEAYPADKYFPSYLLLGRQGKAVFHALFGADVDGQTVRVVTAYYPNPEEWEEDLKIRRRHP